MSRHVIPHERYDIVVGWDHPLQTFFVQVKSKNLAKHSGIYVLWVGCSMREIYEVDDLVRALRPYTKLGCELSATLYADKDEGK